MTYDLQQTAIERDTLSNQSLAAHPWFGYLLSADDAGNEEECFHLILGCPRNCERKVRPVVTTATKCWKVGIELRPVSQDTGRRPCRQTADRGEFRERQQAMRVWFFPRRRRGQHEIRAKNFRYCGHWVSGCR